MQRRILWAAMLSAGLLVACGGGGGGTPSNNTSASVSLSGTAAKGLMANAIVTAHAVKADGSIDSVALATATTDAQGHYSLNFAATQAQPYVIKVTAKADGSTTHLDEVTGQVQSLPAGFSMRSLFVPTSTGTVSTSANITPFSEMAAAAAEKAAGGLTAANVQQAISTVKQLLGFDPTAVEVKDTSTAGSLDEQKLAVMLTAVSQLANTSALGCSTGTAGDQVKCVVEKLADAAKTTTLELQSGGANVSGALSTAVMAVLSNPELRGTVASSTLNTVVTNLSCSGSSCIPASGGTTPTPDPVAGAITAAKLIFTELKSDWTTLFASGSGSTLGTGEVNAHAHKFHVAMKDVQAPAEMLLKDASTLLLGANLYNDYKAGRTTVPSVGRAPDALAHADWAPTNFNAVGCTLYQDSGNTTVATAPANANYIGCRASYFVALESRQGYANPVVNEWRHGFSIMPSATEAGTFSYGSRARLRVMSGTTVIENLSLQPNAYEGTVRTSSSQGEIVDFTIDGKLPGAFAMGTTTLINEHHVWSLSGTRTATGAHDATVSVSGTLEAKLADGSTQGKLQIKTGGFSEIAVSRDAAGFIVAPQSPNAVGSAGGEIATANLGLVWTTAGAEFEGSFAATDSVWSKSLTAHAPTKLTLAGALRTIEGGVKKEFMSGQVTTSVTGFSQFQEKLQSSPTNYVTANLDFVGKATAPGRPVLEFTLGASHKSYERKLAAATMQYRSLVSGTPRMVFNIAATRNASGVPTVTIGEAASNLSLTVTDGAGTADLRLNGTTVVGTVNLNNGLLTFTDGSFISLDLGL